MSSQRLLDKVLITYLEHGIPDRYDLDKSNSSDIELLVRSLEEYPEVSEWMVSDVTLFKSLLNGNKGDLKELLTNMLFSYYDELIVPMSLLDTPLKPLAISCPIEAFEFVLNKHLELVQFMYSALNANVRNLAHVNAHINRLANIDSGAKCDLLPVEPDCPEQKDEQINHIDNVFRFINLNRSNKIENPPVIQKERIKVPFEEEIDFANEYSDCIEVTIDRNLKEIETLQKSIKEMGNLRSEILTIDEVTNELDLRDKKRSIKHILVNKSKSIVLSRKRFHEMQIKNEKIKRLENELDQINSESKTIRENFKRKQNDRNMLQKQMIIEKNRLLNLQHELAKAKVSASKTKSKVYEGIEALKTTTAMYELAKMNTTTDMSEQLKELQSNIQETQKQMRLRRKILSQLNNNLMRSAYRQRTRQGQLQDYVNKQSSLEITFSSKHKRVHKRATQVQNIISKRLDLKTAQLSASQRLGNLEVKLQTESMQNIPKKKILSSKKILDRTYQRIPSLIVLVREVENLDNQISKNRSKQESLITHSLHLTRNTEKETDLFLKARLLVNQTNDQIEKNRNIIAKTIQLVHKADKNLQLSLTVLRKKQNTIHDYRIQLVEAKKNLEKLRIRENQANGIRASIHARLNELRAKRFHLRWYLKSTGIQLKSDQTLIQKMAEEISDKHQILSELENQIIQATIKGNFLRELKNTHRKLCHRINKLEKKVNQKYNIHTYTYIERVDPEEFQQIMTKCKLQRLYIKDLNTLDNLQEINVQLRNQIDVQSKRISIVQHSTQQYQNRLEEEKAMFEQRSKRLSELKSEIEHTKKLLINSDEYLNVFKIANKTISSFKLQIHAHLNTDNNEKLVNVLNQLYEFRQMCESHYIANNNDRLMTITSTAEHSSYNERKANYHKLYFKYNIFNEKMLDVSKEEDHVVPNDSDLDFFDNDKMTQDANYYRIYQKYSLVEDDKRLVEAKQPTIIDDYSKRSDSDEAVQNKLKDYNFCMMAYDDGRPAESFDRCTNELL